MERNIDFNSYKSRYKKISCSGTDAMIKAILIDDKKAIIKKWTKSHKNVYLHEKNIYLKLKNEKYIPNILYFDDKNYSLIIEDVGDSLREIVRSGKKHLLPTNLIFQLDFIMKSMYNKYKLIHGDITFRNICVKNNQICLIDFDATKEIDVMSFDYNNPNKWLCKQVYLLTNYNYFCYCINEELNNKHV